MFKYATIPKILPNSSLWVRLTSDIHCRVIVPLVMSVLQKTENRLRVRFNDSNSFKVVVDFSRHASNTSDFRSEIDESATCWSFSSRMGKDQSSNCQACIQWRSHGVDWGDASPHLSQGPIVGFVQIRWEVGNTGGTTQCLWIILGFLAAT